MLRSSSCETIWGSLEPDIIDEVQRHVLPKYLQGSVRVDDSGHIDDIARLMQAFPSGYGI